MKVGISSAGPSLNDPIDARFGRCEYFIIVDPVTMQHEAIPNQSVSSTSGAGISSAQLLVDRDVDLVLTGNLGPKAANVFAAAGIPVITGMRGTVKDAAKRYATGAEVGAPAAPSQTPATPAAGKRGQGGGMGSGRGVGGGGGRGMGGGGGMGGGCRQKGGSGRGMGRGGCMGPLHRPFRSRPPRCHLDTRAVHLHCLRRPTGAGT